MARSITIGCKVPVAKPTDLGARLLRLVEASSPNPLGRMSRWLKARLEEVVTAEEKRLQLRQRAPRARASPRTTKRSAPKR